MLRGGGGGGDEMSHYEIGGSLGGYIFLILLTKILLRLHVERNLHSLFSQKQSIHRYRYNR